MTQPTPYARKTSFALFSAENPGAQQSGVDLDTEFNAVKLSLDDTQSNLKLLQADDGTLRAGVVGLTQLDASVSLGVHSRGVWVTGTSYTAKIDTVFNGTKIYLCLVTHVGGTFATDLAAVKWLQIADLGVQVLDVNTVGTANLQANSVANGNIQGGAITIDKLAAAVQTLLVPVGSVIAYTGPAPPAGWLFCNGQSVLRASYPALFAIIGAGFGSADSTHFNVPNLQGRQLICQDGLGGATPTGLVTTAGSGIDAATYSAIGGTQTKTLLVGQLPAITPGGTIAVSVTLNDTGHVHALTGASNLVVNAAGPAGLGGGALGNVSTPTVNSATTGITVSSATATFTGTPFGSGTAHSTMDPSMALPFIIKAS